MTRSVVVPSNLEDQLMRSSIRLVLLASAAAVLTACSHSPIPVAENFELTAQKKVRSAGHWELLSRDIVAQTGARLANAGVSKNTPLSVVLPANSTAFDRAFNEFLITQLVNEGYVVATDAQPQSTKLSYRTQVVRHNSPRPHFIPGAATALTAGLYVAHGLSGSTGEAMAGVLGFAALADLGASQFSGGPTAHELVLTTMVESQNRYLVRTSDVYYIENADVSLFTPRAPAQASRDVKVVGQ